mgnify:FL=1
MNEVSVLSTCLAPSEAALVSGSHPAWIVKSRWTVLLTTWEMYLREVASLHANRISRTWEQRSSMKY